MTEERWVLAREFDGERWFDEFSFVGTPSEIQGRRQQWPWSTDDYKVYRLVEVPNDPVQGPEEPPGIRITCPRCGKVDWASLTKSTVFRLVTRDGPSAMLACPCGNGIEVRFE